MGFSHQQLSFLDLYQRDCKNCLNRGEKCNYLLNTGCLYYKDSKHECQQYTDGKHVCLHYKDVKQTSLKSIQTELCQFTSYENVDLQISAHIFSDYHSAFCNSRISILNTKEHFSLRISSLIPPQTQKEARIVVSDTNYAGSFSNNVSNHQFRTTANICQENRECTQRTTIKAEPADSKIDTKASIFNTHVKPISLSSSTIAYLFFFIFLVFAPSISLADPTKVSIHAIIPRLHTMGNDLTREFSSTVINFKRDFRNSRLKSFFTTEENITFISDDTPREILDAFCKGVLAKRAVTILNINNPLGMRRRASSNKYILELANYLGIPVISWDTEYSGSSKLASADRTLQLAPTIEHQVMAMLSLLERYNWTAFTIVTSQVAGSAQFVAGIETLVDQTNNQVRPPSEETKKESSDSYNIIEAAVKLGLTGMDYIWILTRSCIPSGKYVSKSFPVGLMGVSFDFELEAMKKVVRSGVKMWLYALLDMSHRPAELLNKTIPPQFTCDSDLNLFWKDGDILYSHMLNVTIRDEPQIEFNENGTLKRTELIIINLQWLDGQKEKTQWKEVGRWKRHGLQMDDITWPGEASTPPTGKPKAAFLRIATLNELPYVIYNLPKEDGLCEEKALPCHVYEREENKDLKSNVTVLRCCVGFSMDLLKILSTQLNFEFTIKEVEDGKWGSINKVTKQWNGLVKVLLDDEADIVVTAMKINPERADAVRFSVPYLETGIKIIVALRDGAISPTAFLEPFDFFSWILIILLSVHITATIIFIFEWAVPKYRKVQKEPYDYASWSLILIFSVHATGSSILIFEWLSPYGLNRGQTPMREHRFSLFRSFWLIWAMLFSTSVQTDSPKGIASRFLANIWALFALVFLASYTANLAAFMITKEVYYDLSGIQDYRLQNPYTEKPPFKYATIPNGSTEANIRANHKEMFHYMQSYNLPDVDAGIAALKQGKIQAFIYDSSVLEYYASRDPQCRLVTVGNRYAMTGYGIGFQPDFQNPWIEDINRVILKLQENGEMDRLQKFWLAGACNMNKEAGVSNRTLGILNFTSAFILLGSGILLGILILGCEHLYFIFGRKLLRKWDKCGCSALISYSMGKSLELRNCVDEAMHEHTKNRCKNARCETQIWKLKHQLDMALLKIDNLQNQISQGDENLQLTASGDVHDTGSRKDRNIAIVRANGTGRSNSNTSSRLNGTESKDRVSSSASPGPPVFGTQKSQLFTEPSSYNSSADVIQSGRAKLKDKQENLDLSPFNDSFPDPLLPPPPLGESPLLGEESGRGSYDLGILGENIFSGDTYIGFDDLSSNDSIGRSGSAARGQKGAVCGSPAHVLRRTPSYTSAIGGSMNIQLTEDNSPARTGRVRQFDGKRYMGIENDSPPTL